MKKNSLSHGIFRTGRSSLAAGMLIAALGFAVPASAQTAEPAAQNSPSSREPGSRFRDCADCPEMVVIPAGSFVMGSPASEPNRFENEGPQHTVQIPRSFAVGVYDVMRSEYEIFVRETRRGAGNACRAWNGKELPMTRGRNWRSPGFAQTDRDPVVCVNWHDAKAYVAWLNKRLAKAAGKKGKVTGPYRLLSEAEWEYAARAGTTTAFYWGDKASRAQMNYGPNTNVFAPHVEGEDRWEFTSPSGSFPPNPWGLYDMAGNVWQWTEDCSHPNYIGAPADGSAWVDKKRCKEREVRGGAWFKPAGGERSAKRGPIPPKIRNTEIGFRVARTLD